MGRFRPLLPVYGGSRRRVRRSSYKHVKCRRFPRGRRNMAGEADRPGGTASAKGEGDGVPQHYLGVSRARACAVPAAHALTVVTVPRASSQAVLWHISTAISPSHCHGPGAWLARARPPTATVGYRAGMSRTGQGARIAEYFLLPRWPPCSATVHRCSSSARRCLLSNIFITANKWGEHARVAHWCHLISAADLPEWLSSIRTAVRAEHHALGRNLPVA